MFSLSYLPLVPYSLSDVLSLESAFWQTSGINHRQEISWSAQGDINSYFLMQRSEKELFKEEMQNMLSFYSHCKELNSLQHDTISTNDNSYYIGLASLLTTLLWETELNYSRAVNMFARLEVPEATDCD